MRSVCAALLCVLASASVIGGPSHVIVTDPNLVPGEIVDFAGLAAGVQQLHGGTRLGQSVLAGGSSFFPPSSLVPMGVREGDAVRNVFFPGFSDVTALDFVFGVPVSAAGAWITPQAIPGASAATGVYVIVETASDGSFSEFVALPGEGTPVFLGVVSMSKDIESITFAPDPFHGGVGGLAARELRPGGPVFALPPCPGDTNGDRVIDFADLNVVLSDFGSVGILAGDVDHDGDCDFSDLNLVLSGFGQSC